MGQFYIINSNYLHKNPTYSSAHKIKKIKFYVKIFKNCELFLQKWMLNINVLKQKQVVVFLVRSCWKIPMLKFLQTNEDYIYMF